MGLLPKGSTPLQRLKKRTPSSAATTPPGGFAATLPSRGRKASPVLRLSGITKRFGALTANDAISFDLNAGEVIALLGENGAGKTTLMNILFGHYVADEGSIEVIRQAAAAGRSAAALAAGIGMVHQHFTLADNLTVLENIALGTQSPVQPAARPRQGAAQRIASWPMTSAWPSTPMRRCTRCRSASGSVSKSSRRSIATPAS